MTLTIRRYAFLAILLAMFLGSAAMFWGVRQDVCRAEAVEHGQPFDRLEALIKERTG